MDLLNHPYMGYFVYVCMVGGDVAWQSRLIYAPDDLPVHCTAVDVRARTCACSGSGYRCALRPTSATRVRHTLRPLRLVLSGRPRFRRRSRASSTQFVLKRRLVRLLNACSGWLAAMAASARETFYTRGFVSVAPRRLAGHPVRSVCATTVALMGCTAMALAAITTDL